MTTAWEDMLAMAKQLLPTADRPSPRLVCVAPDVHESWLRAAEERFGIPRIPYPHQDQIWGVPVKICEDYAPGTVRIFDRHDVEIMPS